MRRRICAEHGLGLVEVPDPPRDRDDPADYPGAVRAWHQARTAAYADALDARPRHGRVPGRGATRRSTTPRSASSRDSPLLMPLDWDVVPGISAPQILAARHRIVLHEVGRPVHLTPARRLPEALAAGQRNVLVMLGCADSVAALGETASARRLADLVGRQPGRRWRAPGRRSRRATCCPTCWTAGRPRAPRPAG